MSKSKFPIKVKRGHTVVKIYQTPSRGCDLYTVVHYLGNQRQRKYFSDLGLAKTEAERVANQLSQGELKVLTLDNSDSLAYVRAMEAIKPTGVPLEMAAIEFAEAVKLLNGVSLLEAVRYYLKYHPPSMAKKTVSEVVDELIKAKEADRMSAVYIKDLRSRLGRFERHFKMPIGLVTTSEIEDFLRNLKNDDVVLSGKSRNNYRRAIATLIYYAEGRGYLVKGAVDVEGVAVAREEENDIEIFRPEELVRVLRHAEPALIPFLTIGAFAGLRHAELQRLDWAEVRLEDGFIEVKASKAKTASRRLVPITDNLKAWLMPHCRPTGEVTPYANMSKQLMWLTEEVNNAWQQEKPPGEFVWKHNALRHSFISYRVAHIQNVAQVALEAGNSPRMVFSNYRELVRGQDAEKWFGIVPGEDGKKTIAVKEVEGKKQGEMAGPAEIGTQEMPSNIVPLPGVAAGVAGERQ